MTRKDIQSTEDLKSVSNSFYVRQIEDSVPILQTRMIVTINQTTGVKHGLTRSLSLMVDSFDYRLPCNYQSLYHLFSTQAKEQDQSLAVLLRFRISFGRI